MPRYNSHVIEPKWQSFWEQNKTFRAVERPGTPKLYVLDMFPYPSGEGLHVGHPEGYTATDMWCRFKRMRGFNVLHPMGYDAFGLPAEQHAIQTGVHPAVKTEQNIANIRRQIKRLGFSYDWDRELATTDPDYFRWTQWIFLVLFDTWFDPNWEEGSRELAVGSRAAGGNADQKSASGTQQPPSPTANCLLPTASPRRGKGRPISELPIPPEVAAQGDAAVRRFQDSHRLAYQSESPVNWCGELGTVLADEEVINGRSERGDHPVQRIPLRQWMLRITAYAERLVEDLDTLDWPEEIKAQQRNWVGRSEGAEADFFVEGSRQLAAGSRETEFEAWQEARAKCGFPKEPCENSIRIYTTRPDTLFGATYMVLAPEHPLVDRLTTPDRRAEVDAYRAKVAAMSEEDRIAGRGDKSGVFTGGFATNPVNGERIQVWIADYVLISYGTGAIMAVPAHDERDFEFAKKFRLPIRAVVMPTDDWLCEAGFEALVFRPEDADVRDRLIDDTQRRIASVPSSELDAVREGYRRFVADYPTAFCGEGRSIQSANEDVSLIGQQTPQAKQTITAWLASAGLGHASVKTKLRDWLFSRQRYWGEPFPILHEVDASGNPTGLMRTVPESELPVRLPDLEDFKPTGRPEPPLEKATDWVWVSDSQRSTLNAQPVRLKRETNSMPQWAGSCWYYLRFCDPRNSNRAWSREAESYWMPVDLYVGGAEHAVLHLLYSRFWHKVLFDRGHVSTIEPFQRLVNQGMILSITYRDSTGRVIPYSQIKFGEGDPTHAETGEKLAGTTEKMSKARGNVVVVDMPINQYGADTTRLYEMFMGPLEATKPWSMLGVEGISRFLNRAWRMIIDDDAETMRLNAAVRGAGPEATPTPEQLRVLHKTIEVVTDDIESLRFNTAISRLMEFVNFFTGQATRPRSCMESFVLLLAPLAPHIAEELWSTLGHTGTLAYEPWPKFDPAFTRDDTIELPVQVNGKVRSRITVAADATNATIEAAALADPKIAALLGGKPPKKVIVVPKKLVNIVID